jgi:haloalkane dehalogenase
MEQRHVEAQLCVLPAQRLGFLIGAQREFCRAWPNQSAVTAKGAHFLPEDSPEVVRSAAASFVAKVLAGQIR